jgi:hypothetical protein
MTMRALLLASFAAGAMLGAVGYAGAATPPPGARDLGGVNLKLYCQHYYGSNFHSAVVGRTAYDWRCVLGRHGGTQSYGISVTNACLLQYGLPGLTAVALNDSDPTSWRCFSGGTGHHPH